MEHRSRPLTVDSKENHMLTTLSVTAFRSFSFGSTLGSSFGSAFGSAPSSRSGPRGASLGELPCRPCRDVSARASHGMLCGLVFMSRCTFMCPCPLSPRRERGLQELGLEVVDHSCKDQGDAQRKEHDTNRNASADHGQDTKTRHEDTTQRHDSEAQLRHA